MAKKNLRRSLAFYKEKDDNFFSVPEAFDLSRLPRKVKLNAAGLKPNTRYKVMLDNHPGQSFEDITDCSRAIGDSIRVNTHRTSPRLSYLKSDETGKINFSCLPYGTDSIVSTGTVGSGSRDATKLWSQFGTRTRVDDQGRDKIKLIEYAQVNNPDAADRIKTVKFRYMPFLKLNGNLKGYLNNFELKNLNVSSKKGLKILQTFFFDL